MLALAHAKLKAKQLPHSSRQAFAGCRGGLILYVVDVPAAEFADGDAVLDLGAAVHDYATVRPAAVDASGAASQNWPLSNGCPPAAC